jgi:hypothetical protein
MGVRSWQILLQNDFGCVVKQVLFKKQISDARLIQAARPLDSIIAHLEGAADFCNMGFPGSGYSMSLGISSPGGMRLTVSASQ